jgi:hypothetical protein
MKSSIQLELYILERIQVCHPWSGSDIEDVAAEALDIANRLDIKVKFIANDVNCVIEPRANIQKFVADWLNMVSNPRKFKFVYGAEDKEI